MAAGLSGAAHRRAESRGGRKNITRSAFAVSLIPHADSQGASGALLIPRVHRVVDGLDLGLYKEALAVRRDWESKNTGRAPRTLP